MTKVEGIDEFEELLEAREIELQSFKPGPRETEADRRGDRQSLQRRLDQVLYLLVKKPRREHTWQMPQGGVEEGVEGGRRKVDKIYLTFNILLCSR